ncbi:MAG: hypothetical protein IPN37_00090 [Betaproteobacteria bacterium]|nr:hypothetical protein [Betaproteobacteria bacterium]
MIHFKGLVDLAPASAEGRLMLGKALLAAQDAAGAVIELDRAKDLGAAEADLALPLARALAAAGRAKDVVDRLAGVSLPEPRQQAELQVELASALLTQGQAERAESAVASALRTDPANADARADAGPPHRQQRRRGRRLPAGRSLAGRQPQGCRRAPSQG